MRDLTAAILACEDDPVLRAAPLANGSLALATFGRLAQGGPLLVILDEYQHAAEADPTLASQLQRWWSRDVGSLPIYLILCGSYIRFFVQNVLTGPAYGPLGSLQLRPLGYRQAASFFPDWSHEDRVRAFAVTGGIPYYILQFAPDRSLAWNIVHRVLARGAVLYREAIAPAFDHFVSKPAFEEICRAWVIAASDGGLLSGIGQIGAWWGPIARPQPDKPRNQVEGEIEVVAVQGARLALAGEAKWTREPIGFGVLHHLREVVSQVPGTGSDTQLVLFGRSFSPDLRAAAPAEGVMLISVDDLYA